MLFQKGQNITRLVTFLVIFLAHVLLVCSQYNIRPFEIKPEHLNKRLIGHVLCAIKVSVHHQCVTECMSLGACESINFNRRNQTCELNDEGSETVLPSEFVEEKGTLYSGVSEFRQIMAGVHVCSNHKCTYEQRCYPIGNDYVCRTIECGNPPRVPDGAFEPGGKTVGKSRTFSCPDGLVVDGTENITCLHNGTWSHFESACRREYWFPPVYSTVPNYTRFDPYDDGIRVDESAAIIFQAKGDHDGFILLQHDRNVFSENVIEVILGGEFNTVFSLLVRQGSPAIDYYPGDEQSDVLIPEDYRWFWISWKQGCVSAGAGNTVGLSVGVIWCDLNFTIRRIRVDFGYYGQGYFLF